MPRGRRFVYKKSHGVSIAPEQQSCVVCYSSFYQFPVSQTKWESALTKVFYKALSIPPFQTGEEDGDGEVLVLPYCPDCHTKMSVMFNLYSQLEQLQNQYACVRNEIAFIVVETIGKNCKNGPMDFIRQQICDKWQEFYVEESAKEDFREYCGLDALAATSQIELQDIYDSMMEDAKETGEEHESFMDEEETKYSETPDFENCNSSKARVSNAGQSGGRRTKRGANNRSFEEQSQNGENQMTEFGSNDVEAKTGNNLGIKMPRLIPMNPNSRVQKSLASVVNKSSGKFRGQQGRGKSARYHIGGISRNKFYGNHTEDSYQDGDEALMAMSSENEALTVKPSVKSMKKKSLSNLNAKRYKPPKQLATQSSEFPKLQPVVRYPTRNSGRTRSSQAISDTNPDDEVSSLDTSKHNSGGPSSTPPVESETSASSTPGIYTCTLCPKFYTSTSRLLRHESLCHPSLKSFHCDVCKKGFSSRLTYRRHMANVHAESAISEQILQCPICAKTFMKEHSLTTHMELHRKLLSPIKPKGKPRGRSVAMKRARELEQAQESLKNGEVANGSSPPTPVKRNALSTPEKSRQDSISDAGEGDDLTCRICHKVFPYRTLLNMHFITHARKNYKCDICSSAFTSYTELKIHSDEVHRTKLLPCSVCGKGFSGAESLQRHFKVHDLKQEQIEPVEPEETEESDVMSLDPPAENTPANAN